MADEAAGAPKDGCHSPHGRIDLRDVKRLLTLMDRHGLSELELEDEGRKLRLAKGGVVAASPAPAAPAPAAAAAAPAPAETAPPPSSPSVAAKGTEIKSPMVGTFYRSPSPEAAPFVEVGDTIRKDSVVCILEAMKVMNEIKAEIDGEILAVLVQNGEAVEFDQPLLLVKPHGNAGQAE